ncbi:MAG TPA: hypothetical protein VEZ88_12155 [Steroidobacteraceae bacterium]|nr:hypothetical protein [Steroidobacteraceae bacterium]
MKAGASGVLYALGGAGGGLTLYMDKGYLVYLYNMMIIEQYTARSAKPLSGGRHEVEVVTDIEGPGKGGTATLLVDGKEVGKADLKRTVPLAFTTSGTPSTSAPTLALRSRSTTWTSGRSRSTGRFTP